MNSDADDIGPVLSRDSRELYFYSNRPGGVGGSDLYVSIWDGSAWSTPRNLGPEINSPAQDFDPSLSPDGRSLVFSSNRSADAQVDPKERKEPWAASLRGEPGLPHFDLYHSRRPQTDQAWASARPLAGVNSPTANEGAPFISHSGEFLYFASDRPARDGELRNFDIYRIRWTPEGSLDGGAEVENLGVGVNTAANETEPGLSPEGFRLVFSSDRQRGYEIWQTTAREVYGKTEWDTSRLAALGAVWWKIALLLFVLGVLLAIMARYFEWLKDRAAAARFFWASLFVHLLVLLMIGIVPLANEIVERAEEIRIASAPAQVFPSDGATSAPYERVAEPSDAPPPTLSKIDRAPSELPPAPELPTPPESATTPPARVASLTRPSDSRPLPLPDVASPTPPAKTFELTRKTAAPLAVAEVNPAAPTPPAAVARRVDAAPSQPEVAIERTEQRPEPAPLELLPQRTLKTPTSVAAVELKPVAETPRESSSIAETPAKFVLKRSALARPTEIAEAAPAAAKPVVLPTPVPAAEEKPLPAAKVAFARPKVSTPERTVASTADPVASPSPDVPPLRSSTKSPDAPALPALPPAGLPTARLPRRPARGTEVAVVATPIDAYSLRDREIRKKTIDDLGGSNDSEAAVELGLQWLAAHQHADGHWSIDKFQAVCDHPRCADAATLQADAAGTGLALLPFLAAGYTHKSGKFQDVVGKGIRWIVRSQKDDGGLIGEGDGRVMYGHGMAAIAVCEAYGMTRDPELRAAAEKAVAFIVRAQHAPTGGWRYTPNSPGDTSVLGWQVMALKSAELAGLAAPQQTWDGVRRWLKSVEGAGQSAGQFGYQNRNPTRAMTAQGLLCLQLMGTDRSDPRMTSGMNYLLKNLPDPRTDTSYYWYHAIQATYSHGGAPWKAWNSRLRDHLVAGQIKKGPAAGSWTPADPREKTGGRLYATSLRLLMLEVYYRRLPLSRKLES